MTVADTTTNDFFYKEILVINKKINRKKEQNMSRQEKTRGVRHTGFYELMFDNMEI